MPTVFEKADRIGGLLRYGIPDFKMDKALIDRRVAQMEREGVLFRTNVEVGHDFPLERLLDDYEVVVLAVGAGEPARPRRARPHARRHPFRDGLSGAAEPARRG